MIPIDASLSKELRTVINRYSLQKIEEINIDMVSGMILEDSQKNRIIIYPDGQSKTYIQTFGTKINYFYASASLYEELSKVLEAYISPETAYYTPIITVSTSFNSKSYYLNMQIKNPDYTYYEIITESGYFLHNYRKLKKITCSASQTSIEYYLNKNVEDDRLTINYYNKKGKLITTQKQDLHRNSIKTDKLDLDRLVLY